MKKHQKLLRLLLFPVLLLLVISPFLACGELFTNAMVMTLQPMLGKNFVYGMAYTNNASHYKLDMINHRKADLITIGNSRVLQFNDFYFTKSDGGFYNGGSIAASLSACLTALESIAPEALPKTVLLGLDQSFFSKGYTTANHFAEKPEFLNKYDYKTFNLLYEKLMQDYQKGKFRFYQLLQHPARIGVNAKVSGNGYEQDGSYVYSSVYNDTASDSARMAPMLSAVADGTGRFQGSETPYAASVAKLVEIIDFCKENDIYLIAFTPPYCKSAIEIIDKRPDMQFVRALDETLRPLLEDAGFEFYDYSDPRVLGMDDSYFIDAFHGSDTAYLLMTLDMVRQGSRLAEYADANTLQALYDNRVSALVVK